MYVDKEKLRKAIEIYQRKKEKGLAIKIDKDKSYNYIINSIRKIIKGFLNKTKYYKIVNYDELFTAAYYECVLMVDNFVLSRISSSEKEEDKKVNPFNYFQTIARNQILNTLKKHNYFYKNNLIFNFNEKQVANINKYDEICRYNESVNEKLIDNMNFNLFFDELMNFLESKEKLFKRNETEIILFSCFLEYLIKYKSFDDKLFVKFCLNEKKVNIKQKKIIFFLNYILRERLNFQKASEILYYTSIK